MNIYKGLPEIYVDQSLEKTIRVYSSVDEDVNDLYIGIMLMMHPQMGTQEFTFEIDVDNIKDAFTKFDESFQTKFDNLKRAAKEQEVEQSSKIITMDRNIIT